MILPYFSMAPHPPSRQPPPAPQAPPSRQNIPDSRPRNSAPGTPRNSPATPRGQASLTWRRSTSASASSAREFASLARLCNPTPANPAMISSNFMDDITSRIPEPEAARLGPCAIFPPRSAGRLHALGASRLRAPRVRPASSLPLRAFGTRRNRTLR